MRREIDSFLDLRKMTHAFSSVVQFDVVRQGLCRRIVFAIHRRRFEYPDRVVQLADRKIADGRVLAERRKRLLRVTVEHQDIGSGFRFEFYEHGISY